MKFHSIILIIVSDQCFSIPLNHPLEGLLLKQKFIYCVSVYRLGSRVYNKGWKLKYLRILWTETKCIANNNVIQGV